MIFLQQKFGNCWLSIKLKDHVTNFQLTTGLPIKRVIDYICPLSFASILNYETKKSG